MATADSTSAVPTASLATTRVPFFSIGEAPLLTVCEGVPAIRALEQASSFLSEALAVAYSAAVNANDSSMFAAAHITEMAKAILDSVIEAKVEAGDRNHGCP